MKYVGLKMAAATFVLFCSAGSSAEIVYGVKVKSMQVRIIPSLMRELAVANVFKYDEPVSLSLKDKKRVRDIINAVFNTKLRSASVMPTRVWSNGPRNVAQVDDANIVFDQHKAWCAKGTFESLSYKDDADERYAVITLPCASDGDAFLMYWGVALDDERVTDVFTGPPIPVFVDVEKKKREAAKTGASNG